MIIEKGSEARYLEALGVVRNFFNEALKEYIPNLNEEFIVKNFDKYKDNAFLLIIDDKCEGILAGQEIRHPLNNEKVYQEVIWYVNEPHRRYGVYLLKKAINILQEEGYKFMDMVCLYNSKTDKLFEFYQRLGFKPLETHFIRSL